MLERVVSLQMEKQNEIRIVTRDVNLYNKIKSLAKANKRTIGKQAEFLIEQSLSSNNTKKE